ncbi:DUF4132 domain-containing protein [Nonomuraea sp. NPDC050786]|uniref:DUF4132 domain-containing protein n=1 Tax=Nonomuraea sp. NPDC050786 TaxID=3154840 RepID=UPI0034116B02
MQLSPAAQRLHRRLTEPDADHPVSWEDGPRLSAADLGALLPLAYRVTDGGPAFSARTIVEDEVRQRQPSFSPESCVALYEALVDGLTRRKWADLCLAAAALLRCPGGAPTAALAAPSRTLIEFMAREGRIEHPDAFLAVAGLAGMDKVAGMDAVAGIMEGRQESPAAAERDLVMSLDPAGRALLAEIGPRSFGSPPELPDVWERLAAMPAYVDFARSTLEAADARLAAIHAGEIPYRADRAFGAAETGAIGRAARLALFRDEPWLPDLLDRLISRVAVAPTTAKTLPSQALLYEVARAVERFPTPEAITALRTARTLTRHAGVVKQLDRMIRRAEPGLADRVEVAFRMPDLGFGPGGRLEVPMGEHRAVVAAGEDGEFALSWWHSDRRLKAAPAALRKERPDEVKRLRELVKQVQRQVRTLVRALEAGFAGEAAQPYGTWQEQIAAHPIASTVAARLIWEAEVAPGEWRAALGGLKAELGAGEAGLESRRVRLWHPARATLAEVTGWREAVAEGRVRQPFKQAFREVYLLTPAEERTAVYSNRFAGHIVDYRRLYAMFKARGWRADMLGPWDGGVAGQAMRVLAEGQWRASFYHDYLYDDPGEHASTDQVRFHRRMGGEWREASLAEVPALVFSEAMRDVDLFVAVTSIAADPQWADRGHDRHLGYWQAASFGELPPSAEVRREALARLLPRLAIADRCTLTDRYLVVRGDLRTYKIHLGSANILMEPGDVYLCIVSAPDRDAGLFLPFEDDGRLALILSKALLLAEDSRITDETIIRQIKG